jgi:aryl-alcohol dehydrogenase-like predicted oxidoreductase
MITRQPQESRKRQRDETNSARATSLGATDLETFRLGFAFGWGPQADEESMTGHPPIPPVRQLSRVLELVRRLHRVVARYGTTAGTDAIAWTLHHPAVDGATVGLCHPDQVDPTIGAANLELDDDKHRHYPGQSRKVTSVEQFDPIWRSVIAAR